MITIHGIFGMPVDDAAVAAALPMAETAVRAIAALQADAPFMTGGAISLADIALVPHLDALAVTPEGRPMVAAHPRLGAWLEAMRTRPSVLASRRAPDEVLAAA